MRLFDANNNINKIGGELILNMRHVARDFMELFTSTNCHVFDKKCLILGFLA